MTTQVDFVPFAASGGANVESQTAYLADSTVLADGFVEGVAVSTKFNKVWRQATIMASVIANYMSTITGSNVIDDGTTSTIIATLAQAIRMNAFVADNSSIPNVINATITPAPTLLTGMVLSLQVANTNTSSVSFNLNGLGAYAIVSVGGALTGGELTAGLIYQVVWLAGTSQWLLMDYQTTAVTQSVGNSTNRIATTAYVMNAGFAPLASPNLTGNPTAPTQAFGDSTTKLASTAFVQAAVNASGFPSGTRLLFAQPTAPTGWVQDTTTYANNRMLRVVSVVGGSTGSGGSGGNGFGGVNDPTIMNVVPAHTHTATSTVTDPGHAHTYDWRASTQPQSGSATQCWWQDSTQWTGTSKTGITVGTSVDTNVGASNYQPYYLNLILCQRS